MSCTDPELSSSLQEEGDLSGREWRAHLTECADCRTLFGAVAAAVREDPAPVHPSGAVLAACDESPDELDPAVRRFVEEHLAGCALCRDALSAVAPEEPLAMRPARRRAPLAAAAAVLLAATLGIVALVGDGTGPDAGGPRVVRELVLSAARSGDGVSVPDDATHLVLALVLAEEVAAGETLVLQAEDAAGRRGPPLEVTVTGVGEWGWPEVEVPRSAFPEGALTLHVRTPSGREASFALEN